MADPMRRAAAGEPFIPSASLMNALMDLVRAQGGPSAPRPSAPGAGVALLVRNASGGDLARFAVAGLDDLVIGPADNEAAFLECPAAEGVAAAVADHAERFAVLQEDAPEGAIVRAVVAGVTPVQVNVSDIAHACATVADGQTYLASAPTGLARILVPPASTGLQWLLVCLGGASGLPAPTAAHQVLTTDDGATWGPGWVAAH
jgi:hypothetical protein